MDGIEVCRTLKADRDTRDIPIIFLSASLDFEERLQGLASGAIDFIKMRRKASGQGSGAGGGAIRERIMRSRRSVLSA